MIRTNMIRHALSVILALLVLCATVLPQLAVTKEAHAASEVVWHIFDYDGGSYDVVKVLGSNGQTQSIYARDDGGNRVADATLERRLVVAAENLDDLDEAISTPFVISTTYGPSRLYALTPSLEDRDDDEGHWYSVTYPSAMPYDWLVDNVLEEGWIDKGLDDYDKRVDVWKKVIWSTVISEVTTRQRQKLTEETIWLLEQVKEHESSSPQVIALAEKAIKGVDITEETAGLLGDLFGVAKTVLENAYLDHLARTGEHLVNIHHWSVISDKISSGLKTAPWAGSVINLGGELVQAMMWNALATAEAQARLDTLKKLAVGPEWDPALIEALPDVQSALDEYSESLASALWEGVKDAVISMSSVDFLVRVVAVKMAANTVATGAIAALLGVSTATAATIVIPVALITYAVLRGIYDYVTELHDQVRGFVLAATLNRYLGAYMPDSVPSTLEGVEYAVRINNMGYYLENYYYYQYRDYNGRLWVWSDTPELNPQLDDVIQSSLDSYWRTAAPYWLATDEWPNLRGKLDTPTIIIDTPSDGASVSGIVTISAHATDAHATDSTEVISEMTLKIDGTSITSGVNVDTTVHPATLSYEWDTSTLDPGSAHDILVQVKDASGTPSTDSVTVTIQPEEGDPPPVSHAGMSVSATSPILLDGHSVSEITATITEEGGDPIGGVQVTFWSYPPEYAGFAEPDGTLLSFANYFVATTSYATGEATAYYRPTRWGRTYIEAATRTGLSEHTHFDAEYEPAAPADFHIDVSPSTRNVGRSETTTYEVTVVPENGFYRPVTLTTENLPADVSVSGGTILPDEPTTINVSVGNSAPYGTHTFQIVGIGDEFSRSEDVVLVVNQGTIELISPNGGEIWYMDETHNILWNYGGGGSVHLDYSVDGGRNWLTYALSWPNDGSLAWDIASNVNRPTKQALFRIRAASDTSVIDISDDVFTVSDNTLYMRLISPGGGEVLPPGSFHDIKWTTVSDADVTGVDILYSSDGGATWTTIVADYPDLGVYRWHLPTEMSDQSRIKVVATDSSPKTGEVQNNTDFTIGLDPGAWVPNHFGHEPERIQVDPTNSSVAYLGDTTTGLFKTDDAGLTITLLGGPNNVADIDIDPSNTNIVYVSDSGGGLYKTTNGGATWQVIASGDVYYPPYDDYFSMDWAEAMVLHPNNPSIIFLGSDEGIFKSTNGGSSWDWISETAPWEGNFVIDPSDPDVMYVGSSSVVEKSIDGGYSWTTVGTLSGYIQALVMDPQNPSVLYAGAQGGLFRTTDGGSTWTPLIQGTDWDNIYAVIVDPSDSDTIYVGTNAAIGVLRSRDGGNTWDSMGPENVGISGLGLGTTPSNLLYAGSWTGIDGVWVRNLDPQPAAVLISPNGGEEWLAGSEHDILWTTTDSDGAGPVDLYHSSTGDAPWETIATGLADTGSYNWKLPITPGPDYKVKVVVHNVEGETVEVVSEETFTVAPETMPPAIPEMSVGQEVAAILGIFPLTFSETSEPILGSLAGEIGTSITISAAAADSLSGIDPSSVEAHLQYPDNTDVALISLHDDGTSGDEIAGDGIFTGQWDSSGASEAFYFVDISASDLAANERVVDNAALVEVFDYPSVTAVSQDPLSPTDQAGATVTATITDTSGVLIANLEYSSDGGTTWPSVPMSNTSGDEWSGVIPQLAAGTVQLRIMATDALGHSKTTEPESYDVLDVTPPMVDIVSPTGNSVPASSAIEIAFTEAVNTSSVEGAISTSPPVTYSMFWMGDRLLITPDEDLAEDTEYEVTILGTAQDSAGNGLDGDSDGIAEGSPNDDYTWFFTTASKNVEVWVDDDWAGSSPGDSVCGHTFGVDAFTTIQGGIDAVASSGTVHVAEGTYPENVVVNKAVTLLGGYSSCHQTRDPGAYVTIVDGGGIGDVISVEYTAPDSVIDGFTLTNGIEGVHIDEVDVQIVNNNIHNNTGYGVHDSVSSSSLIENNRIHHNGGVGIYTSMAYTQILNNNVIWENGGGGVEVSGGRPTIQGNTIKDNNMDGIFGGESQADIIDNLITGNAGDGISVFQHGANITANRILSNDGWGIHIHQGVIANNMVGNNTAGGIFVLFTTQIVNNTVADNTIGGGIEIDTGPATIVNNIVWGNTPQDLIGATATYTCIGTGNTAGVGNISLDPQFVNPAGDDYHLQGTSPCIDAGSNAAVPFGITTDFEGDPRIWDGDGINGARVDMGADEYPYTPLRFHGTVQVDGADAADGTVITATIEGDTYTTTTPSIYGNSTYTLTIAPPPGTAYTEGATITFAIGGRAADQTGAWEEGGNVELNLSAGEVIPGDCNGDGVVNAIDITCTERIIAGLDAPTPGADANGDGNINALDITKIERIIAGID